MNEKRWNEIGNEINEIMGKNRLSAFVFNYATGLIGVYDFEGELVAEGEGLGWVIRVARLNDEMENDVRPGGE